MRNKKNENLNNWRVVNVETSKNDEIDDIDLAKNILHGIENRMSEKIGNGNYGVMRTDNPETDGYYTVEWISIVYTAQDDIVMKGHNLLDYVYASEMVCRASF